MGYGKHVFVFSLFQIGGFMKKILALFKQKTTLVGVVGVAGGIVQITQGDTEGGVKSILAGLGLIFIRQAVAKSKA